MNRYSKSNRTKNYAKILLIASIPLVFGCGDDDENPKDFAYNGISAAFTDNPEIPIVAIHEDGDVIGVLSNSSQTEVTGAVLMPASGPDLTVWLGDDGLPKTVSVNGFTILFEKWNGSEVDVAVISPNGEIEIIRGIEHGMGDQLSELSGLSKSTLQKSVDLTLLQSLRIAGLIIQIGVCLAGLITTAGTLLPAIAIPCGLAILSVVALILDNTSLMNSSEAFGVLASIIGCSAQDAVACVSLMVSIASAAVAKAESDVESVNDEVDVAGGALAHGTGDVQITLTWDNTADVDLWVTDPFGERIYFAHPTSQSGGWLDVDDIDGFGPENVFWPFQGAPEGTYIVQVDHYSGTPNSNFIILVQAFGQVKSYTGTVDTDETADVVTFASSGSLPKVSHMTVNSHEPRSSKTYVYYRELR